MKSIPAEVKNFFRREKIPSGAGILAAASGGPDSTALALALAGLREELGFSLVLAHYDHGLRSRAEAENEEAFVRALGASFGVPVETGRAGEGRLRELAAREKKSLEAAAREERYAFLRAAASRTGCALIALGHTRADRIETQVFRFFQGADASAFAGIRGCRGELIRPLIGADKSDVLAFLAERGQKFCVDPSNTDTVFLRNHVRAELLPAAEKVFPGFASALDALAEKSLLAADFAAESLREKNPWVKKAGGWECSWEDFIALHPFLRVHSVYGLCPARGEKRIPYAFVSPLAKLEKNRPDGIVLRGRGVVFFKRAGMFFACGESPGLRHELRGRSGEPGIYDAVQADCQPFGAPGIGGARSGRPERAAEPPESPVRDFLPAGFPQEENHGGAQMSTETSPLVAGGDIVLNEKKGYFYRIDGNMDFCIEGQLRVRAEEVVSEPGGDEIFSCGKDSLFLRSRRPGDCIRGAGGTKALGRLLAEWKVDERFRDAVPLVQKNGKIVAVLAAPWGGKTLRLPEDFAVGKVSGDAGGEQKFFRLRIRKIGENSGQQTESE